jgi:hypothetical protein
MTSKQHQQSIDDLIEIAQLRIAANRMKLAKMAKQQAGNPEKPLTRRDAGGS